MSVNLTEILGIAVAAVVAIHVAWQCRGPVIQGIKAAVNHAKVQAAPSAVPAVREVSLGEPAIKFDVTQLHADWVKGIVEAAGAKAPADFVLKHLKLGSAPVVVMADRIAILELAQATQVPVQPQLTTVVRPSVAITPAPTTAAPPVTSA